MRLSHRSLCSVHLYQVFAALAIVAAFGCSGDEPATDTDEPSTPTVAAATENEPEAPELAPAETVPTADASIPSGEVAGTPTDEPLEWLPEKSAEEVFFEPDPSPK
jgi:hypothetical protein